jgi:hypothetical protein
VARDGEVTIGRITEEWIFGEVVVDLTLTGYASHPVTPLIAENIAAKKCRVARAVTAKTLP